MWPEYSPPPPPKFVMRVKPTYPNWLKRFFLLKWSGSNLSNKGFFGGWCSRKVDTCWHQNTIKYQMIGNAMQNTFQHDTLKMFLLGQLASGLDVSPIYDIRCVHHKHFGGYENLNKSGFHQFIRIQPTTSCRYLLDNKCRWSFPSPPNKKLQVSKPTLPTLRYAVSAVCCGGLGTAFYFASLLGLSWGASSVMP